jgi:hypothetical protein
MPRYSDEWVIDRVLFDYVSGGSCACCGLQYNMFLLHGTEDLIQAVSDLDTDQKTTEIQALAFHPWPKELRDQIWSDRVKIRQKLKLSSAPYTAFWNEYGTQFTEWFYGGSAADHHDDDIHDIDTIQSIQRCLQMSRSELLQILQQQYQIHSAYSVVLNAVVEQVAYFPVTGYSHDSCGGSPDDHSSERQFEQALRFDRMCGGFTLPILEKKKDTNHISASSSSSRGGTDDNHDNNNMTIIVQWDIVQILLNRIQSLGGPKLLDRNPTQPQHRSSSVDHDDDADDDGDADDPNHDTSTTQAHPNNSPSFQSDRRIVRLVLARYWADVLMQRFLMDGKNPNQNHSANTVEANDCNNETNDD